MPEVTVQARTRMSHNKRSLLCALTGTVLLITSAAASDYGNLQAPWGGLLVAAAAAAFVAAGVAGRGWRALLGCLVVGVPITVIAIVNIAVGTEPEYNCDRGCPGPGAYAVLLTAVPLILIICGIAGRRAFGWLTR